MKVQINLASEPFRHDRPLIAGVSVLSALLTISLAVLIWQINTQDKELAQLRQQRDAADRQLQRLVTQESKLATGLRTPENAVVFDQSEFLNGLLVTKGISWTKMFDDLGGVMPPNVKLVAIRPQVFNGNQVRLDMTVASDSPEPVVAFMVKLEASPRFGQVQPYTSLPPTENEKFYRFRIGVNYAQKL